MKYAGSGKPIPITDPVNQQRVARLERLAAIRGPADKTKCALCAKPETTDDVYGVSVVDNRTGARGNNSFHLCAACVPIMEGDFAALKALGERGVN
jgi:hypothetical protein